MGIDDATKTLCLVTIIARGRGFTRRTLEAMVNAGKITVEDAQKVWTDAFGGKLIAVPDRYNRVAA